MAGILVTCFSLAGAEIGISLNLGYGSSDVLDLIGEQFLAQVPERD